MSKKRTIQEFIKEAHEIHNNFYDYSLARYENNSTKITIVCPKHGSFSQTPRHHINRKQGCVQCYNESKNLTTKQFIKKAKKEHGFRYDYSEVKYISANTPVKIICKLHGPFYQKPVHHMHHAAGCQQCGIDSHRISQSNFIKRANEVHKNRYDYSESTYTHSHVKVKITCPIHRIFWQTPANHTHGTTGCPNCHVIGTSISAKRNSEPPASLYYIKIIKGDLVYYKIGVTSKKIKQRFSKDINNGTKIQTIMSFYFQKGGDAYCWEDFILLVYDKFRTNDKPLTSGNTEVFDIDIFNLSNNIR